MAKKGAARYSGRKSGKARRATTLPATEHVHVFGRTRPSHSGTYLIHGEPKRDTHFRPLPLPTSAAPFHLDLRSALSSSDYQAIVGAKKLTFQWDHGRDQNGIDNADFS